MIRSASIDEWRTRLGALVQGEGARELTRVFVAGEIASTQDEARARGSTIGDVVVAWRQTSGRGRFGRAWVDTAEDGVAISFVMRGRPADQVVMRASVAVADAVERVASAQGRALAFGIKWPNDILAPDRGKVAGILIERVNDALIVGIGINVGQRTFDTALAPRARSLAMLGIDCDRLDVIETLIGTIETWFAADDGSVREAYQRRDALRGTHARFTSAGRLVEGKVVEVDPTVGIRVATAFGEEILPAATTTLAVDGGGNGST